MDYDEVLLWLFEEAEKTYEVINSARYSEDISDYWEGVCDVLYALKEQNWSDIRALRGNFEDREEDD